MMEAASSVQILTLTRDLANLWLPQLLALDQAVWQKLGNIYSDESWGEEEFTRDLHGKWTYSALAIHEKQLCGFWISSQKTPTVIYTHRVAIEEQRRQLGIGGMIFDFLLRKAVSDGLLTLGLSVSIYNNQAIRFYEKFGFVKVVGEKIYGFLDRKNLTIEKDFYQVPSGQRNYLYILSLRDCPKTLSLSRGNDTPDNKH
jgi:ribosomal protein S18 acetylase RimI-like enzyme